MTASSISQYRDLPLKELVNKLNKDYYELIGILVKHADERCAYLITMDVPETPDTFQSLCSEMLIEIRKGLEYRANVLIPYINELAGKDITGHNCSTCSGRCEVQHSAKTIDFMMSIEDIKTTIQTIRKALVPEYSASDTDIRILHNEMTLLDNILNELLLVEEVSLLPKMKLAQKNINAVS